MTDVLGTVWCLFCMVFLKEDSKHVFTVMQIAWWIATSRFSLLSRCRLLANVGWTVTSVGEKQKTLKWLEIHPNKHTPVRRANFRASACAVPPLSLLLSTSMGTSMCFTVALVAQDQQEVVEDLADRPVVNWEIDQ
jgi:hypothetical protein